MKNYVEPIVNLLYVSNEDVIATSDFDPFKNDEFDGEKEEVAE